MAAPLPTGRLSTARTTVRAVEGFDPAPAMVTLCRPKGADALGESLRCGLVRRWLFLGAGEAAAAVDAVGGLRVGRFRSRQESVNSSFFTVYI